MTQTPCGLIFRKKISKKKGKERERFCEKSGAKGEGFTGQEKKIDGRQHPWNI